MEARSAGQTGTRAGRVGRRAWGTETKHSSKTTELYAMIAVIAGILVAAALIDGDGGTDTFVAKDAWLYVAIVASAYLISRGLAKSGTREPTTSDVDHDRDRDRNRDRSTTLD